MPGNPILALFVTIAVEFLIIWAFMRKKPARVLLYTTLINCFTWPLANSLASFANVFNNVYVFFLAIEAAVFLAETFLIKFLFETNYRKALLISFAANLLTASMSLFFIS